MEDELNIVHKCLTRIKEKYDRRGKSELWTDGTREEFLRAFALVPLPVLPAVLDEVLLNPPTDDRGREINWLPDPSDILRVARKLTQEGSCTPSDVVGEIMDKISRFGIYGRPDPGNPNCFLEGSPALSPLAEQAVRAMGGWGTLCLMEAPDSVVNGLLLKHAQNFVEAEQHRLLIANRPTQLQAKEPKALTSIADLLPPVGNGKNG